MENSKLIPDTQASKILGIAVQTLRNWRQEGKGPAYLKIGRSVKYSIDDLKRFLEAHKINPTGER